MARKHEPSYNDNNMAIAYYRFSSHSQNEDSIDQQREAAHKYAAAKGFTIVKEYEDRAISGTTEERPGFQLMLSEVAKLRPAALIMWKTDRLGRDRYVFALAKKAIRDAGCKIHLVAETIPEDSAESSFMEGMLESMAEFYAKQAKQNINRGMRYNAENGLYNGHKMLGYTVDESKHYVIDPATAPIVQRIFADYGAGKRLTAIVDELNSQGIRTSRGAKFTVNSLRSILQNQSYIGIYQFSDIVRKGAIPPLVSEGLFEQVKARFAENKRKGAQVAHGMDEADAPRYWLTGHLYCGHCGESMQGVSGTSRTGAKHYYYYCSGQRRRKCKKKPIKKALVEWLVVQLLEDVLNNSENLASLAADAAAYHEKYYKSTAYIDGLIKEQQATQRALNNLVKAIEQGIFSETTQQRLTELEAQKKALAQTIETEQMKAQLAEDEHSIKAYFQQYANANLNDPATREMLLDYFIDKIYVYDDQLEITGWFSGDRRRIEWKEFSDGEIQFNVFASSSTKKETSAKQTSLFWWSARWARSRSFMMLGVGGADPCGDSASPRFTAQRRRPTRRTNAHKELTLVLVVNHFCPVFIFRRGLGNGGVRLARQVGDLIAPLPNGGNAGLILPHKGGLALGLLLFLCLLGLGGGVLTHETVEQTANGLEKPDKGSYQHGDRLLQRNQDSVLDTNGLDTQEYVYHKGGHSSQDKHGSNSLGLTVTARLESDKENCPRRDHGKDHSNSIVSVISLRANQLVSLFLIHLSSPAFCNVLPLKHYCGIEVIIS